MMTPKEECELLLSAILPAAQNLLKKHREFYPIGAVLTENKEIQFTETYAQTEFPSPETVIRNLTELHKQMSAENRIVASAIAWNGGITTSQGKNTDAILVSMEHRDNYRVVTAAPYQIGLFKRISFHDIIALEGLQNIF